LLIGTGAAATGAALLAGAGIAALLDAGTKLATLIIVIVVLAAAAVGALLACRLVGRPPSRSSR
jgi:hypothetical protein